MNERSLTGSALALGLAPLKAWQGRFRYDLLVKRSGLPIYRLAPGEKVAMELAYVDLFQRLCAHHAWLQFPIFPVGGAASHAFLAILVRALVECGFSRVLEFGAGQTTRILSAWSRVSGAPICTVENDEGWVKECQRGVTSPHHQIVHAPLRQAASGHVWYDFEMIRPHCTSQKADLIIVDGPVGAERWSRAGFIERFSELHADEWVVLWDDLHRQGDLQSFAEFIRRLRSNQIPHDVACCQAFRTLGLVFSPKYSRVKHYC
ncbi:MAG: hypothetical protein IH623_07090 [Verrucomicrobia bacterium]|nr:hypothetical protein [Verrucomicrobiota bacterium]